MCFRYVNCAGFGFRTLSVLHRKGQWGRQANEYGEVVDFLDELLSNLSYLGLCVYLNTDGCRDLAKLSIGLLNLRLNLIEQSRDLLLEPELINLRYNVIYSQDAFSEYVRFRFLQLQL